MRAVRIVNRDEFRRMLAYALRRLPAALRPKHVDAAAIMLTERPPLDQLEITIREGMRFGDMGNGPPKKGGHPR